MKTFSFKGKEYQIDGNNFLKRHDVWDENFAAGMALELGMKEELTEKQWEVIRFIRDKFRETGICPVVHETTQALGLNLKTMQRLFPTGYLRGACLLAGITYQYGWVYYFEEPYQAAVSKDEEQNQEGKPGDKVYRVNLFGYLVDPAEWDVNFAARRAYEMNMQGGLTRAHWQVIKYLRASFQRNGKIPTIYECCEANRIDIEEFSELFPTGYHRGAIKIAGLPTL